MEGDSTAVSDHDAVGGLWNCDESQIKLATVAASLLKCRIGQQLLRSQRLHRIKIRRAACRPEARQ